MRRPSLLIALLMIAGCAPETGVPELSELPEVDEFCLAAQRVVTRTDVPVKLVVHDDFMAFVKSKAVIDGPEIQQYNWRDDEGRVVGISCKLKSADHLNLTFGDGSAGPDGLCQDMNRAIFELVAPRSPDFTPAYRDVVFDRREAVFNEDEPGMTGPDWLKPFIATSVDDRGKLQIRTKGFLVNFSDPAFAQAPPRFRGIHYCHFLAPSYLAALMRGEAKPGIELGRAVDSDTPSGMER